MICDDHSSELDEDVLYITDADLPDDVFRTIMLDLPNIIMRHYHSYPELIVYYPEPLPYEKEKSPIHKAKEQMAQIIARDIMTSDNTVSKDGQTIQFHLDNEQMNYILAGGTSITFIPNRQRTKLSLNALKMSALRKWGVQDCCTEFLFPISDNINCVGVK